MALKLLMNVTYGYTAASVSGRMPCVDLADSIIKGGRDLLSNLSRRVELHNNLKIVYGDTDSVFVLA